MVRIDPRWRLALVALCVAAGLGTAVAQRPEPEQSDPEFARLVREWTTRPEFLSPLVDHLPVSKSSPEPKDVLGYHR